MTPQMGEITTVDVAALIAAHAADLDAHTRNIFETVRIGAYHFPFGATSTGAVALAANRLYSTALHLPRAMTIDRLSLDVTIAGAGGTKARLGIYADNGLHHPGALIVDGGEVAVDGVALVAAAIAESLPKGLYWLACVTDGTPSVQQALFGLSIVGRAVDQVIRNGWSVAFVYAALPDPFTAGATEDFICPGAVRFASMD